MFQPSSDEEFQSLNDDRVEFTVRLYDDCIYVIQHWLTLTINQPQTSSTSSGTSRRQTRKRKEVAEAPRNVNIIQILKYIPLRNVVLREGFHVKIPLLNLNLLVILQQLLLL